MAYGVVLVEGERMRLRSMGIEPRGPSVILVDNAAALFAATSLKTALRVRHLGIDYTVIREAVARKICYGIKTDTKSNYSDVLTKDKDHDTFWTLTNPFMDGGKSVADAQKGEEALSARRRVHDRLKLLARGAAYRRKGARVIEQQGLENSHRQAGEQPH
jgi:hypothetical protein